MITRMLAAAVLAVASAAPAAAQQPPLPVAAINAAKSARAKVEAAHQKNAEALAPPVAPPSAPVSQPPASAPAPAQPPTAAPAAPPQPESAYSYDAQGRRDPFVSLLNQGASLRPVGSTRPQGLQGLLINEISVKGIFKAASGFVAIVQGSDNKTYIAHPGDRVFDGSIKSIAQDAIVFSQDVTDPLSTVKQREVRKTIRPEAP